MCHSVIKWIARSLLRLWRLSGLAAARDVLVLICPGRQNANAPTHCTPLKMWAHWNLRIGRLEGFPEESSSACFWHKRLPETPNFCSLMSLWQILIYGAK